MNRTVRLAIPAALIFGVSCSSKQTSTPAPAPTPAPTPAGGVAQGRGSAPGGRGGAPAGGRAPMTPEMRAARRDSIAKLREATVQQVLASIAGHENEPAGEVFKNVQLLKDMPAGEFVKNMDQMFGRALSQNCTSCHVADQWEDDSRNGKKTARLMIEMMDHINADHLSKLPPNRGGQTPKITCVTCHRGNGNPGSALLP